MHALPCRARLCCAIIVVATVIARAETSDSPPPPPTAEERLEKILDSPGKIEFHDATLSDAAAWLAQTYHIPVILDVRELEQAGVGPDLPVYLTLESDRFSNVLTRLLSPHDLAYTTTDGVLTITTADKASNEVFARVYDVVDLVRREPDDPADDWDYDSLVDLLTNIVQPDSWDENGGKGTISPYDGTLSVSQTSLMHVEIRDLLRDLRAVRAAQRDGRGTASRAVGITSNGESLRRALDAPCQLEARDLALSDFVRLVADRCSIRIDLDWRELEQAGLGPDTPVTCPVMGVPLRVALERTLAPLDVSFCLVDDVVLITTKEKDSSVVNAVIYPVADLLRPADASDPDVADYDGLIDVLVNTCQPDSWDENGGKGSISPFELAQVLVISQTDEVHRQIEDVLANLRRVRSARPEQIARAVSLAEPVIQVYPISDSSSSGKETIDCSAATAVEVAALIDKWIGWPDWTADESTVAVIGSRVVVKAPPQVQRQVKKLIDKLGVGTPKSRSGVIVGAMGGSGGGGMGGSGGGGMGGGGGFFTVPPADSVEPSTPQRLPR